MAGLVYPFSYQLAVIVFVFIALAALPRSPHRAQLGLLLTLGYVGGMVYGAHALKLLVIEGTLTNDGAVEVWGWLGERGLGAVGDPIGVIFLLMRTSGGLWGGPLAVLAIVLTFMVVIRMPRDDKAALGDAAAIGLPFALALCKVGCFAAGCCHGAEGDGWLYVTDTWSMDDGEMRTIFPTQLMDLTTYLIVGFVMLRLARGAGQRGRLLLWFTLLFCVVRFASELTRGDELGTHMAGMSPVQLVLIVGALVVTLLLARPGSWESLLAWRVAETAAPLRGAGAYLALVTVASLLWVPIGLFAPVFAAPLVVAAARADATGLAHRGACFALGVLWLLAFVTPSLLLFVVVAPLTLVLVALAFSRAMLRPADPR